MTSADSGEDAELWPSFLSLEIISSHFLLACWLIVDLQRFLSPKTENRWKGLSLMCVFNNGEMYKAEIKLVSDSNPLLLVLVVNDR